MSKYNVNLTSRRNVIISALVTATAGRTQPAPQERSVNELSSIRRRIEHNLIIRDTLVVESGTRIVISAGATLTLLGDIDAPAERIFDGPGIVDMSRSRVLAARPEWWGATTDDPSVDNITAFNACLAAHPVMQLGLGDYHLKKTWIIGLSNRRIWGIGRTKDAGGTRLLRHGSQGAVVLLGSIKPPPTINEYARGIDLRWIELGRSEAAGPISGQDAQLAAGLVVRHVLDAYCEGLRANEHSIGYSLRGAVRSYFHDCVAFRSAPGRGGRSTFIGFDLDGRSPPIETGANASIFLIDCNASVGNPSHLASSVGCRLTGALSDTFLVRFETASLAVGIEVDGQAASMSERQRRVAHIDLNIDSPVLDQCREVGLRITGMSDQSMVSVNSPYVGLSTGATAAIELADNGGFTNITGGQLIGMFATAAVGVSVNRCSGPTLAGTIISGFTHPVRSTGVRAFEFVVAINSAGNSNDGPAVQLTDCHSGYLRPRVAGPQRAYGVAVEIDRRSRNITVEAAALETAITSGKAVIHDGRTLFAIGGSAITIGAS